MSSVIYAAPFAGLDAGEVTYGKSIRIIYSSDGRILNRYTQVDVSGVASPGISPANRVIIIANFTSTSGMPTVRSHIPWLQARAGCTLKVCSAFRRKSFMDPIWALFIDVDEHLSTGKPANAAIQPETHMPILNGSFQLLIERLNELLRGLVSSRSRSKNFELFG